MIAVWPEFEVSEGGAGRGYLQQVAKCGHPPCPSIAARISLVLGFDLLRFLVVLALSSPFQERTVQRVAMIARSSIVVLVEVAGKVVVEVVVVVVLVLVKGGF